MHLILTSRADPPLPLARLRARRHLSEIRAADLRFTPAEAAAFLNEGRLQQALQLCQDGLELVARHKWHNFPAVGFLYVAFGDLLRE